MPAPGREGESIPGLMASERARMALTSVAGCGSGVSSIVASARVVQIFLFTFAAMRRPPPLLGKETLVITAQPLALLI